MLYVDFGKEAARPRLPNQTGRLVERGIFTGEVLLGYKIVDRVAGRLAEVHDKPDGAIWFRYCTQWGDVIDREGGMWERASCVPSFYLFPNGCSDAVFVLVCRLVVLGEGVGEGATKTNIETELKTSNNAGDQTLVRGIS